MQLRVRCFEFVHHVHLMQSDEHDMRLCCWKDVPLLAGKSCALMVGSVMAAAFEVSCLRTGTWSYLCLHS